MPKMSLPTLGELSLVLAYASSLFAIPTSGSFGKYSPRIVRFLLAPIQVGFQKVFISSSDLQFYSVLGILFTLLAILFTLLPPRTAGPNWLEKFAEPEKTVLACQRQLDGGTTGGKEHDVVAVEVEKNKAKSGPHLFGHKLNVFNCFYLGVNHLLAFHAVCLLLFAGGKDVVLEFFVANVIAPIFNIIAGGGGNSIDPDGISAEWSHQFPAVRWSTLLFALALWPVTELGITAGVHRLWAHRSYEATPFLKAFLMLLNSIANQGTIFHWARDHRVHHRFSDRDADPHDSRRGWFFSHIGWLLIEKTDETKQAGKKIDVTDLLNDKFVMFQKYTDPWWNFAWCFAFPAFFSLHFCNDTLWNGFLFAGVLRYVFVLHCTWAVNSIVHSEWGGSSVYDEKEPPAESRIVAFLSCGEGWHSWHHAFAFDYAAAELGCLQQWNPTKAFIDGCWWLGLVGNRKRGHRMWALRKEKLAEKARERGLELVETLAGPPLFKVRGLAEKAVVG